MHTITTTSQVVANNERNLYVQTMAPTIYHFAALAKEQENPIIGFHLADSCRHMLRAMHGIAEVFDEVAETACRGAGKGAFSYVKHSIKHWQEILASENLMQALDTMYLAPLRHAGTALGKALMLAYRDPRKFAQRTSEIAIGLAQFAADQPDEAIAQAVELSMNFLVPAGTKRLAELSYIQPFVKAIQKQKKVAAAFATSEINKKIVEPIKEIFKNANINWTNHGFKHFPPKNMSWKDIVKLTKKDDARYRPGINIETLERMAWEKGVPVTNGKTWKVFKADDIIGAKLGIETPYMRIEMSANTIHGHPITPTEYAKYIK